MSYPTYIDCYRCKEFEEKYFWEYVKHEYYVKYKHEAFIRGKSAFKSCLTKNEFDCENTECEYYNDREPNFVS